MTFLRSMLISTLASMAIFASSTSYAEQMLETTDYQIHYNAFNTMMVPSDVAQSLGFTRARNRALLNVSVLDANTKEPMMAMVKGQRKNLLGQIHALEFQQVVEQGAIYYIAELRFSEAEMWKFEVQVQPDPHTPAVPLKFTQTFYIEQE